MAEETKQEAVSSQKTAQDTKADMRGMVDQFEAFLDEHMVKNAPFHIPAGGKEFIVKVSPYVIIVMAIIAIPVIVAALGITALLSPFAMMGGYYHFGVFGLLSGILSLVALVIELSAVKGLFARTHASWRLLYYVSLISLASSLISFNIVGGIISSIIGWYILFQVKSLYTKK
jgi:hypothetical protein